LQTLRETMSDDANKPDTAAPPAATASPRKLAEKQRLAEALRENLKRRRAQARGRRAPDDGNSGPGGQ